MVYTHAAVRVSIQDNIKTTYITPTKCFKHHSLYVNVHKSFDKLLIELKENRTTGFIF